MTDRYEIIDNTIAEIRKLRERNTKLETTFWAFVNKLDAIHDDPAYKSVWTVHQIHVGPYQGPTYTAELAAARAVLMEGGDAA
jgi:hypothetical protein